MNLLLTSFLPAMASPNLQSILIGFLVLIVVLAVIGGLVWAIEAWIHPLPPPVKLVLAIVLVILVILWGMKTFMGGAG